MAVTNGRIRLHCADHRCAATYAMYLIFATACSAAWPKRCRMYHKSMLARRAWYVCVMQVDTLQQRCTATDAQAVQLQQQLTNLHADKALLGARLHDGSLDMVKGQLIQQLEQQLAESTQAAAATGAASQHTSSQVQSLQDQLALQQQAQASERERLSMEAAQSRLLCKARARQVNTLELQYKAQVSKMTLAIYK